MAEEEKQAEVVEKVIDDDSAYKTRIILFITGIVVLLILIATGLFFLIFSGDEESQEQRKTLSLYEKKFNAARQLEISKITKPIFVRTEPYTVNLKGQRHYLKMTIVAVLQDQSAADFLQARLPMIDDKVIMILKRQSISNLRTRVGLELLKQKFYQEINRIFDSSYFELAVNKDRTPVKEILINDMILN